MFSLFFRRRFFAVVLQRNAIASIGEIARLLMQRLEMNAAPVAQQPRDPVAQPRPRRGFPRGIAVAFALALAAGTAAGGCDEKDTSPPDGMSPDGGTTMCASQACKTNEVCSLGRCTSTICQLEEQKRPPSMLGCLFYTLDVDNVTADASLASSVLVTNPSNTLATVQLQQRNALDHLWTPIRLVTLGEYEAARIVLPPSRATGEVGLAVATALQITSDTPIVAAHVQSDDEVENAGSSGGTFLLPAHVLGLRYMTMSYPQDDTGKVATTVGGRKGAAQIILVGTADGTKVDFTVSNHADLDERGGTPVLGRGKSTSLTLNDGDVFQIFSVSNGDDLTGSQVVSDRPVAVFSGNISTTYGREAPGINSPDMAHEQMLPTALWGTEYVTASLPPQARTCDGFFDPPGATRVRVLAGQDDTFVDFELPPGVTIDGGRTSAPSYHLDAGELVELTVAGGSVRVTSTRPAMVTEGLDCEASLSGAIATASLLTYLRFATLPHFDQMLALVRQAGDTVALDGFMISDAEFVPAGGGFEVAHVPVPPCPGAQGACPHELAGRFGVALRGMDVLSSYAMTAPTWVCDMATGCVD